MRFIDFLKEEDGMGTAEIVIIAGVLVAVALLFKDRLTTFVTDVINKGLNAEKISF